MCLIRIYPPLALPRLDVHLVTSAPLLYLLSVPEAERPSEGAWPVLCFLHGHDEGPPTPIRKALTRHGPLHSESSPIATSEFIVVAPQMTARGDVWHRFADDIHQIVREVQALHHGDPRQTYLTGFSYGGNGVCDIALEHKGFWAALWPVDPTRVPDGDLERPLWLSSGEVSRRRREGFMRRLNLALLQDGEPGDRVYVDEGQDHVGTARSAYQDRRIYRWLLSKQLAESVTQQGDER